MLKGLIASLALVVAACSGGCGGGGGGGAPASASATAAPADTTTAPVVDTIPIHAPGYTVLGPIFNGAGVVESQYFQNGSSYGLFFGCGDQKTCFIPDFVATPQQSAGALTVPNTCRFPYAFKDQGAMFLACVDTSFDWNVYLWRSTDLQHWQIMNNAQPILRRTPGTQWANIWNVAILPINGRWHMLAETHSDLTGMDLAYAWADPAVSMDFTPNEGPVVIPHGGNPELHLIAGQMVAIHGMFHDRTPTDPWYVTYSTADPANPTTWTTHRDRMLIEEPGIDVADPTYIETGGKALIAVSYDQNKVVQLEGPALTP